MKLIMVDDSLIELNLFAVECAEMPNFELVGMFQTAQEALDYVQAHQDVDFALLDIDMPVINGIELAARLRHIRKDIIIIFVTGHTEFAAEAIRQKADYVVFKPFDKEDVLDALERAQLMRPRQQKRLYCRTFGAFDMFIDGNPVRFRSHKAKELMALLVCYEGKNVSIHDIVDCLWDGDDTASVNTVGYRKAIKNLTDTLAEYDAASVIERTRGFCRLNADEVDSDYYQFLRGNLEMIAAFQGQFLSEYPWSEPYIGRMLDLKEKKLRST